MPETQASRNTERIKRSVPLVLLAASLLTLTISTRSLEGLPKRIGVSFFGFFQRGFSAIGNFASGAVSSITELRQLRKDYDALLLKLESYANLERGFSEVKQENERLKSQLGYSAQLQYEKIPARIVAKDPENIYATIVIDKGIEAGIRKNMPVIAFQNGMEGLVGRVVEVGRGSSIVVPLYDSSSYIAGRLATSRYEGLVTGRGSADEPLVMKFVKKRAKDEIQFGDLVVTSGYESVYPPEVSIARVAKVRALDYQTSIEVDLEPVLDFARLEYVFVVRAGGNAEQGQTFPAGSGAEGGSK
jgi:rod shape-determining protein MreC